MNTVNVEDTAYKMNDNGVPSFIEYGLIIALFYVTGGAFSYTNYSVQITVFFLITFSLCIITGNYHKLLFRNVFLTLFFMCLFLFIIPVFNNDSISSYIAIMMQLFIGAFCAAIIPIKNFKEKYIRVIVTFAIISLIFFGVGFVYPSIALRFPVYIVEDASVEYRNAVVYVYMVAKGYSSTVLTTRNSGICWEPGCYQMFLNVALYFLLSKENTDEDEHFNIKFIVLVITIITTLSTTGLILLACNLILFFKVWRRKIGNRVGGILIICVAFVIGIWLMNQMGFNNNLIEKINREFLSQDSESLTWLERISLDKISYMFKDGFWFFGMSFSRWTSYGQSLWNSVIHSFLCLGIPFTLMQLYLYLKGSYRLSGGRIFLFIIMVACASTETLFWRVFFDTCAFYGIIGIEYEDTREALY